MDQLNLDQIINFLRSEDWCSSFDSARVALGKKLSRKHKIHQPSAFSLPGGELEISAKFDADSGQFHEIVLSIWLGPSVSNSGPSPAPDQLQLQLEGSCTCEFATNCEHAAALIFFLSKGHTLANLLQQSPTPPTRAANTDGVQPTSDKPIPKQLDAWISEFLAISQVTAPSKTRGACLIYLIAPTFPGAELRLLAGTRLKNEQTGSSLRHLNPNQLAQICASEDHVILEELDYRSALRSNSQAWSIQGMAWELLLKRMALTGRLIAEPDSPRQRPSTLNLGEPRNGQLGWQLTPSAQVTKGGRAASHYPCLITTPPNDFSLLAGGAWYIDRRTNEIGRILLQEPRQVIQQWLAAPSIDATTWQQLPQHLAERGTSLPGIANTADNPSPPPASQPPDFAPIKHQASTQAPRPTLNLRLQSGASYQPELVAKAWLDYHGHQIPLTPSAKRRAHRIKSADGSFLTLPRDQTSEDQALRQLQVIGLELGHDQQNPIWLPRDALITPEHSSQRTRGTFDENAAHRYWQRFRWELAPLLEENGWSIRFAPGIGHQPLIFRAASWQAEMVEEARGWFNLSAGFEVDGQNFELQPLIAALLEGKFMEQTQNLPDGQEFLFYLPDGQAMVLPVGRFRRLVKRMEAFLEFRWKPGQPLRLHKTEAAALLGEFNAPDIAEADAETNTEPSPNFAIKASTDLMDFAAKVAASGQLQIPEFPVPTALNATLRPYQHEGFRWLNYLSQQNLNGILADDMGLGKTLQTLTYFLAIKAAPKLNQHPSLVIAPTSVIGNWQREAEKFAPTLRTLLLQGPQRHDDFHLIPQYDLILTSYALLARDLEHLAPHHFHLIALDEAQHIKNAATQVSEAARQLSSSHRLCLSGTPVENNLAELWSLMDFLNPGLLGSHEQFQSYFQTPIEKENNHQRRQQLTLRIAPLILRRTKSQVATELPPKTYVNHLIELNEPQKEHYETVRSMMDKQVRQAIAKRTGNDYQMMFLDALLKLRQVCCHPRLLDPESPASSAKFDYFTSLLEQLLAEQHRTLVFSQFTSMLTLIEQHLQSLNILYLKLTGETQDRQALVEQFQSENIPVFLISLKAGGTGLTLTAADTVIHYDPWWNPAVENQATDRAYRIGQTKPVIVHKLICQNTVETRIQAMQQRKGLLADDVLSHSRKSINQKLITELLAP